MLKKEQRKSFIIRPSGRSSDFISPSFGHGCLLNCSYCYMKRHKPTGLSVATNTEDILTHINNHAYFAVIDKPNQTDAEYVTYDIACNEDFALHHKYHDWKRIFEFFRQHPIAKATLATKVIPDAFKEYNPERKVRIRFSLMPQVLSDSLEKNTPKISERIASINSFIDAGYDVHVNFSPVILYRTWYQDYKMLFEQLNDAVKDEYKKDVLSEVIFLTHNEQKHVHNVQNKAPLESLLWNPEIQEPKVSQYGGTNVRYKQQIKQKAIQEFTKLHDSVIPWNKIRYIF